MRRLTHRTGTHFLVFVTIALLARFWAVSVADGGFLGSGVLMLVRSILSDIAVSLLAAITLGFVPWRAAIHAMYGIWAGFFAGNIVHILFNAANIDLLDMDQLGEREFVRGSVLSFDVLLPWTLLWIAAEIIYFASRRFRFSLPFVTYPLMACAALAFLFFVPTSLETDYWRQYNVFEENKVEKISFPAAVNRFPRQAVNRLYKRMTALDLSGTPLETYPAAKPNILIVTIEGLSNYHILQGYMPYLQSLAAQSIYYPNFVYVQQYTRSGLFSMLCGDYFTFNQASLSRYSGRDKWYSTIKQGPAKPCLPEVLAANGYSSLFFQASGLSFAAKGKFMNAIGFQKLYTAKQLQSDEPRLPMRWSFLGWGMADNVFLPSVARRLKEIDKKQKEPWFAVLMTTGTHQPYNIPPTYASQYSSRLHAAYHMADEELQSMMRQLEEAGILDHTLVFITGDESRVQVNKSNNSSVLSGNWGVMIIKTPNNTAHSSPGYFMPPDIMASILDYIGASTDGAGFRSMFRKYDHFRPMMFAGAHTKRWFTLSAEDRLVICTTGFQKCQANALNGTLFNAKLATAPGDDIDLHVQAARMSDDKGIPENQHQKRSKRRNKSN